MQNLLPLILIGFFIYLIYLISSRKGGMGCGCGHGSNEHRQHQDSNSSDLSHNHMEKVIDLRKDEYTVLPSDTDHRYTGN